MRLLGLEQVDPEVRARRDASGIPGEPPPEPTSTTGPSVDERGSRERVVDVDAPRLGEVADGRQAGCRDERLEPAVEPRVVATVTRRARERRRRAGSAPSRRST